MPRRSDKRRSFPFSITLAVVGVLLLFGNFKILQLGWLFEELARFWPIIVVAMGVNRIITGGVRRYSEGLVMIIVGLILQMFMLGLFSGDFSQYWPVLLILVGLWLIFVQPKNTVIEKNISENEIHVSETVRGTVITVAADTFQGGSVKTLLSVVECDLSQCTAGTRFMKLHCGIRASRIAFYIPEEWRVEFICEQSMSSVEDRRALGNPPEHTDAPVLQVEGRVQMAQVSICDADALRYDRAEEEDAK